MPPLGMGSPQHERGSCLPVASQRMGQATVARGLDRHQYGSAVGYRTSPPLHLTAGALQRVLDLGGEGATSHRRTDHSKTGRLGYLDL